MEQKKAQILNTEPHPNTRKGNTCAAAGYEEEEELSYLL